MALKTLMLRKQADLKKRELAQLKTKREELDKRQAELEASIAEVENDEQRALVDAEIEKYEADAKENADQTADLER